MRRPDLVSQAANLPHVASNHTMASFQLLKYENMILLINGLLCLIKPNWAWKVPDLDMGDGDGRHVKVVFGVGG